jgi:hypothetical protein
MSRVLQTLFGYGGNVSACGLCLCCHVRETPYF